MAFVIVVAGKGGQARRAYLRSLSSISLKKKRLGLLLMQISNSRLNEALGADVHATIGHLREESLQTIRGGTERPGGMSMEQLFDYQVQQSVIEAKGFDFTVMGRPEGPGCYCAANNIIRKIHG